MTALDLYLLTRADSLSSLSVALMAVGSFFLFLFFLVFNVLSKMDNEPMRESMENVVSKAIKIFATMAIVGALINVFVPSTKQLAMIYVLPKIANSESMDIIVKEMPELVQMATDSLKEMMKTKGETK